MAVELQRLLQQIKSEWEHKMPLVAVTKSALGFCYATRKKPLAMLAETV